MLMVTAKNSTACFDFIIQQMIDRFILLFSFLSYASACLVLGPALDNTLDLSSLRASELAKHNQKRALHNSNPLSIDEALNTAAQAYANYLAINDLFTHSSQAQSGSYGENLYWAFGSPTYTYTPGAATLGWYSEEQYYNYATFTTNNSGKQVGHFTAMVWKSVTKVGFGFTKVKSVDNGQSFYVVANYAPTPNVAGQYAANVISPPG